MFSSKIFNFLILLSLVSCGARKPARDDKAVKDGIPQMEGNAVSILPPHSENPDTLVAFFWPTEKQFNILNKDEAAKRYSLVFEENVNSKTLFNNYQSFIRGISNWVFHYGNEFDDKSIDSARAGEDYAQIETQLGPQIEALDEENKILRKKKIDITKLSKEKIKQIEKLKLTIDELNANLAQTLETLNQLSAVLTGIDCAVVINDRTSGNFENCTHKLALEVKKLNLDTEMESSKSKLTELNFELTQIDINLQDLTHQITVVMDKKANIDLQMEDAKTRRNQATNNMSRALEKVQLALDPNTFIVQEDDLVVINPDVKPLSWINYKHSRSDGYTFKDNIFRIKDGEEFVIKFVEWSDEKIYYSSEQNDIIDIKFKDDVLTFKMKEKSKDKQFTGAIYEVTLQRSLFDKRVRYLGDLNKVINGQVVLRGQMKIDLPFSE